MIQLAYLRHQRLDVNAACLKATSVEDGRVGSGTYKESLGSRYVHMVCMAPNPIDDRAQPNTMYKWVKVHAPATSFWKSPSPTCRQSLGALHVWQTCTMGWTDSDVFMLGILGNVGAQTHGPQKKWNNPIQWIGGFSSSRFSRQAFPTGCDVTDFPRGIPQVCSRSGQAIPCSHRSLLPTYFPKHVP